MKVTFNHQHMPVLTPPTPRRFRRKAAQAAAERKAITSTLCVAAIRGSTEDQRLTIPTQGAAITKYCEAKGLELVAAFIDSGTCGKTPWLERESTRDMLRFMVYHGIQNIVYTRLDRAFRSGVGDAMLTLPSAPRPASKSTSANRTSIRTPQWARP